jgi:hypothetical protein
MNRFASLFVVFVVCFAPVRVLAQPDAGTRLVQMAECMSECMEQHAMCVSTNDIQACIQDIPSCQALASSDASIIQAFCDACDNAADGCEAPSEESPPELEPARGAGRGRTEASRERPPTPPPVRTVEDLCRVAGGIWDPDYAVIQSRPPTASTEVEDTESPYEGEEVRGVCWTREGERLARLLRDERASRMDGDSRLEALIEEEAESREVADTRLRAVDDVIIDVNAAQANAISRLSLRMICVENGGEDIRFSSLNERVRDSMRRQAEAAGMREGDHINCSPVRYRTSGAGTFGFRFSLMPGLGFQPLTNEQTIESPIPFYLMGELSLTASIGGDWFIDGGLGFGYPFPDYRGRTMLEGMYHLGFMAVIENVAALGFGGILMERYTDVLQSMHTIAGGYVEADYNLRRGGWQPYIGLRVVLGVGMRAGFDPVLDGAAFIMLGIAHLDADDGNVDTVFDDCDTPMCRDTAIGRVQVP